MNKEALRKVEKFITKEARHFGMNLWLAETDESCGTTCCLAGAAYLIKNNQRVQDYNHKAYPGTDKIIDDAKQFLGIDESESKSLFSSWGSGQVNFVWNITRHGVRKGVKAAVVRRIERFIKNERSTDNERKYIAFWRDRVYRTPDNSVHRVETGARH